MANGLKLFKRKSVILFSFNLSHKFKDFQKSRRYPTGKKTLQVIGLLNFLICNSFSSYI